MREVNRFVFYLSRFCSLKSDKRTNCSYICEEGYGRAFWHRSSSVINECCNALIISCFTFTWTILSLSPPHKGALPKTNSQRIPDSHMRIGEWVFEPYPLQNSGGFTDASFNYSYFYCRPFRYSVLYFIISVFLYFVFPTSIPYRRIGHTFFFNY